MTQIGGVGHHVTAVPVSTFQTWLQLSKVLEFTYTPAVMFAKLAALFLYHQLFEVTACRRLILLLGVVIILQGVVALILAFAICRPFRYFRDQVESIVFKEHGLPPARIQKTDCRVPCPCLLYLIQVS